MTNEEFIKMKFILLLFMPFAFIACKEKKEKPQPAPTPVFKFGVMVVQEGGFWTIKYTTDNWGSSSHLRSRIPSEVSFNGDPYVRLPKNNRFASKEMAIEFAKRFTDTTRINQYHDSLTNAWKNADLEDKRIYDSIENENKIIIY